jgi:hypothetical protein
MRTVLRSLLVLTVAFAVVGAAGVLTGDPATAAQKAAKKTTKKTTKNAIRTPAKKPAGKQAAPKQPEDVARFNGTWSVLIVTQAGTCDRAYRYSVQIVQGSVRYGGETPVTLTGGVDPGGRVAVSLSFGQASAGGSGRLSGDEGSGTWSGHTANARCSGYWEAERRGR